MKFFEIMEYEIKKDKNIINMYDDKNYFNNELKSIITEAIEEFLEI